MVQCSSLSFLAVTKLLSQLQLVLLSIGYSMVQLAISTTMSGRPMAQGSCLLAFYQKVSCTLPAYEVIFDLSFLAEKEHATSVAFHVFRHKLYHISISLILQSLCPGKITPKFYLCPDWHYWRVIWGIGPYIADYPEQVLLACIVQDWCAKWAFLPYFGFKFILIVFVDVRAPRRTLMVTYPNCCVHVNWLKC